MPRRKLAWARPSRRLLWFLPVALPLLFAALPPSSPGSPHPNSFTLFESGQVRPLALDPDGRFLYALNTPDGRLEIFRVHGHGPKAPLEAVGSVQVGLEPVAVAARDHGEVWVVNHLSDSVSVVDVSNPRHARVERTCWWAMSPATSYSPARVTAVPSSPPPTGARTTPSIPS